VDTQTYDASHVTCDVTYPHHGHLMPRDGMRSISEAPWCEGIPTSTVGPDDSGTLTFDDRPDAVRDAVASVLGVGDRGLGARLVTRALRYS